MGRVLIRGKSIVAGIVDRGGGLRVVVTDGLLSAHIGPGERAFVLPRYKVQEPIPFTDIPALVDWVERYVRRELRKDGARRSHQRVGQSVDRSW